MKSNTAMFFNVDADPNNSNLNKTIIINKDLFLEDLSGLLSLNNINDIKSSIYSIFETVNNHKKDVKGLLNITSDADTIKLNKEVLLQDLNQILNSQTIERAKYYIDRLINSITVVKTSKVNDININRWKEYDDILTESLWILDKRDNSGAHNGSYWGNFIPQIPNQFIRRYTKKGEWVLDPFLGSGTTLIECRRLGRNGIGVELLPEVVELANDNISLEKNTYNVETKVICADSTKLNFNEEIKKFGVNSVQFIIMHPPYWDIIKFSENDKDLSNAKNINDFLNLFGQVIDNTYDILDKNRYLAVVIGDKYSHGEWIPLGFYTMNEVLKRNYTLKSIIIKNFEETKGKRNQKELWRYRALVGGFYIFKHEYIFLFRKN